MTLLPWLILALLTVGVVLPLLRVLFKTPPSSSLDEGAGQAQALARAQWQEIEGEWRSGLLSSEEAEASRREIARRLLYPETSSSAGLTPTHPLTRWARPLAIGILLLMLPLAALFLYLHLGAPASFGLVLRHEAQNGERSPEALKHLAQLSAQLLEQAQSQPDNLQAWLLLGRTYLTLGRGEAALAAFAKVLRLAPDHLEALSGRAEARILAAAGTIPPQAVTEFETILARAPNHFAARYYLALHRWQQGQHKAAFDRWLALYREIPPDSATAQRLRAHLQDAATRLGIDLNALEPPPPTSPKPAGPSQAEIEAAQTLTPDQRQAMIEGMVAGLARRLQAEPQDGEGWIRLAQAYEVLERWPQAAEAYGRALQILPKRADLWSAQGAALVRAQNHPSIPEPAAQAFRQALDRSPEERQALWYLGAYELQSQRPGRALDHWRKLATLLPADSPDRPSLEEAIRLAESRLAETGTQSNR